MAALIARMKIFSFFAFLAISIALSESLQDKEIRTITVTHNPDCNIPACKAPNNISLYHISANGLNDSLHYFISNIGQPTILTARFESTELVKPTIDWKKLLSKDMKNVTKSVKFNRKPQYSTALIFSDLIEYDDVNDTANVIMNNSDLVQLHPFNKFNWQNGTFNSMSHELVLQTTSSEQFQDGGSLWFKIKIQPKTGRQDELPHLQFNSNLTQIDFGLDRFQPSFNQSRYGLNIIMISEDFISDCMPIVDKKSLDDGHSPGVFEIINWRTRPKRSDGTYVQWRPIAYTMTPRTMKYGVTVQHNHSHPTIYNPSQTVTWAYYGYNISNMASQAAHVTFGLPGDGFYTATNFTVWTANFGYGNPPDEEFSSFVIILVAIGLGLPFLLIVVGSVILCVRRRRNPNIPYTNVNT